MLVNILICVNVFVCNYQSCSNFYNSSSLMMPWWLPLLLFLEFHWMRILHLLLCFNINIFMFDSFTPCLSFSLWVLSRHRLQLLFTDSILYFFCCCCFLMFVHKYTYIYMNVIWTTCSCWAYEWAVAYLFWFLLYFPFFFLIIKNKITIERL